MAETEKTETRNLSIYTEGTNQIRHNKEDGPIDFAAIRVGMKKLEDAIIDVNAYKRIDPRLGDKQVVQDAINRGDLATMRDVSNFFYRVSGIYSRLCRYLAYLYKYDWLVTPYINDEKLKSEKILTNFNKILTTLEDFGVKQFFNDVALKVVKNGCYYGYRVISGSGAVSVQELPPQYCRTRYRVNGKPVVEFNMKFFDEQFRSVDQRVKMLKLFPPEFKKGYILYKEGKLVAEAPGDTAGWYLLDTKSAFKFNLNGSDFPVLISVIPAIIDLDEAQELDRKKTKQNLLKIIIQKMPIDKNGELVFDVDEAQQLHNNVVRMLGKAVNLDVLTTFADVEVANLSDRNTTTTVDDLAKVERTVYNNAGISQLQFNTDGNIALEKSILNDEALMLTLVLQFQDFLNGIVDVYNTNRKKVVYRVQILTTTIYNYKEMSKLFKEQTQLGYSKMLPQIALGQSQSAILANAYFENDILNLVDVFIPPMMSSVMNAEAVSTIKERKRAGGGNPASEEQVGRPEKADDQKSEKTIQNRESMS